MVCGSCGASLPDGSKFCSVCGAGTQSESAQYRFQYVETGEPPKPALGFYNATKNVLLYVAVFVCLVIGIRFIEVTYSAESLDITELVYDCFPDVRMANVMIGVAFLTEALLLIIVRVLMLKKLDRAWSGIMLLQLTLLIITLFSAVAAIIGIGSVKGESIAEELDIAGDFIAIISIDTLSAVFFVVNHAYFSKRKYYFKPQRRKL